MLEVERHGSFFEGVGSPVILDIILVSSRRDELRSKDVSEWAFEVF
jgi:hypothetical protein